VPSPVTEVIGTHGSMTLSSGSLCTCIHALIKRGRILSVGWQEALQVYHERCGAEWQPARHAHSRGVFSSRCIVL
jgi:hypothetical protein